VTRSWIVGGALRDELLGREVTDIDIAVAGDPEAEARELAAEVRGPVFRLSEAFGAWRVVDRKSGRVYDFAPLQGESVEEDLRSRDFTVNAMARPRDGGELIDPLGGRADIEARTLLLVRLAWSSGGATTGCRTHPACPRSRRGELQLRTKASHQ